MYGYIYMTINILNGKRYIGKHKSQVFVTKYIYAGSGKFLVESINKNNGVDHLAIELLDTANSKEELNNKEIYWIEYYNAVEDPMFYNLKYGGDGGDITISMSNEDYNCYIEKLRQSRRNISDYTRNLMRERSLKRKHTQDSKIKIGNAHRGKIVSSETRDKISKMKKGVNRDKESCIKQSETLKRNKVWVKENNPMYKNGDRIRGSNNPCYNKICINKDGINKFVYKSELEYYISIGWNKGMVKNKKR